uniref:tRNA-binding domain-containing protein n=1 Tax=Anopheles melas TaxID=34690 RepID=A0A182TZZ9_9DIPT
MVPDTPRNSTSASWRASHDRGLLQARLEDCTHATYLTLIGTILSLQVEDAQIGSLFKATDHFRFLFRLLKFRRTLQPMFGVTFGTVVKRIFSVPRLVKMSDLQRILSNNKAAEELLESLKQELKVIKNEQIQRKIAMLQTENETLRRQVDSCLKQLVSLEVAHGKVQIPVPTPDEVRAGNGPATVKMEPVAQAAKESPKEQPPAKAQQPQSDSKPPKEKKPKKEKPAGGEGKPAAPAVEEPPIDVGRLDMRVGRIVEVSRHPDADSLYVEKIDCGEPNGPRTVISGLVKYVPIEEMQNRMVVALCNLKPAKMRGILSEAMVMCASTPDRVEILAPPADAVPGDLVHVEGYPRVPDSVMNPKKKIFETVAPDLKTNGELVACYKEGSFVVPGKGPVKAQTLKNVQASGGVECVFALTAYGRLQVNGYVVLAIAVIANGAHRWKRNDRRGRQGGRFLRSGSSRICALGLINDRTGPYRCGQEGA